MLTKKIGQKRNGLERKENKKATIKRYRPIMAFFKEVIPLGLEPRTP